MQQRANQYSGALNSQAMIYENQRKRLEELELQMKKTNDPKQKEELLNKYTESIIHFCNSKRKAVATRSCLIKLKGEIDFRIRKINIEEGKSAYYSMDYRIYSAGFADDSHLRSLGGHGSGGGGGGRSLRSTQGFGPKTYDPYNILNLLRQEGKVVLMLVKSGEELKNIVMILLINIIVIQIIRVLKSVIITIII